MFMNICSLAKDNLIKFMMEVVYNYLAHRHEMKKIRAAQMAHDVHS